MIERPINKAKNSSNGFLVYYTQKKKSKEKRPSIISFQQCDMILILLLLNELMLEPYHHDKELGLNKLHKETFNYLNSWRQKKKKILNSWLKEIKRNEMKNTTGLTFHALGFSKAMKERTCFEPLMEQIRGFGSSGTWYWHGSIKKQGSKH